MYQSFAREQEGVAFTVQRFLCEGQDILLPLSQFPKMGMSLCDTLTLLPTVSLGKQRVDDQSFSDFSLAGLG